jgi:hypothetical protein
MHRAARRVALGPLATLVVCILVLIAPGGGGAKPTTAQRIEGFSQKLRDVVSTRVTDEARKAQMLMVVDQMEALHMRFSQQTTDFVGNYRKLNEDYNAPRAAFDQLFSEYNSSRVSARNQDLDLHFKLAALATAGEWDAISKAEANLYEAANAGRAAEQGAT